MCVVWVLTGGEVARGVGGALLVVQQREGVQLVGGAGRQVAQHVRPVAGALHADVARAALQALRQRDHLRTQPNIIYTLLMPGAGADKKKRLVLLKDGFLFDISPIH